MWVDPPLTPAQMQGRFRFLREGKPVGISQVRPSGDPTSERVLPRTPGRVILAGTLQAALGGREWDPDGESTQMTETLPGVHELVVELPRGRYEFKVARNGSWDENYGRGFARGGPNLAIEVPRDRTVVKFVVDFPREIILNSIDNPSEVAAPASAPPKIAPAGPTKFPVAVLKLAAPLPPRAVAENLQVVENGNQRTVFAREVLVNPAFVYEGNDLGARWSSTATAFRVWSPVSRKARLLLFPKAVGGPSRALPMTRGPKGTWQVTVPGNLHGVFYQFQFESYGQTRTTQDIYGYSVSPDSKRSMVVDLKRTNPAGWPTSPRLRHARQTDAVLYEISVRDFTSLPSSGVPSAKRGKYAGLVHRGATVPGSRFATGLDYLVDLGVTDIHLLPTQNFLTGSAKEYTWGYATNLFNVPEETYSMSPQNPAAVIKEYKSMVAGIHKAGLRVVMDVVYNHTWPPQGKDSAFWETAPYYYLRTNDRGDVLNESGVGNALNDERPMARKFVRESLLYWLREYKVDGFRFDLLGMHHPDSVRDWVKAIRKVRPDATIYGEPWTGGGPTRFPKGAQRGMGVAVFNDTFRNLFRGDLDGNSPGFATGGGAELGALREAISGSPQFADSPEETVNYVSAHDNMTLLDRIRNSVPEGDSRAALRLAGAAVLLSQGVPFLEGGAEIGRTKGGNHNTYDAGDLVNGYHWERAAQFADVRDYYRGLIQIRRQNPVFRLGTGSAVAASTRVEQPLPGVLLHTLKATRPFKEYLVVFHGGLMAQTLDLPPGDWQVLATGEAATGRVLGISRGTLNLKPLSAYVLAR